MRNNSQTFKKTGSFIRLRNIIVLILFFCLANVAPRQILAQAITDENKGKVLSLKECLALALDNNHKIKASGYGISISEMKKKQAESGYWPNLSIKAAYSYSDKDPIFAMPSFQMSLPAFNLMGAAIQVPDITIPVQEVKLMDKQNIHAMLEMSYPVYTGGKIQALNEQAAKGIEISRQEYRKSNLETEYDVVRYYYSALLAKKIYKIGSEALEKLDVTLKLTESMYKNGSGRVTKLDYLRNKVMVDQVRTIVTDMKKNVKLSKDALAFTFGVDIEFSLPEEEIPFAKEKIEFVNAETQGYTGNPDWAKLNAAMGYYQAKIDEAYSGYLPKIALTGSFAQNINSYNSGFVSKNNRQIWTVSLGAEIPLFDGFRTSNEVNEASVKLKKTEEEKTLLQDAVTLQIKEAVKRVEVAAENVNNTLEAKSSASENCALNERAFQQEMAGAKDLIEAQIMESLMEIQHQKALYDHAEAEAYFYFLTGRESFLNDRHMANK